MLIYHGSRSNFEIFEKKYKHSGEGVGDLQGHYFTDTLYGAYRHCSNILHCTENEGFVYVCEVPEHLVSLDIESGDNEYHSTIHGVEYENEWHIHILDIIPHGQLIGVAKIGEYHRMIAKKKILRKNCLTYLEPVSLV